MKIKEFLQNHLYHFFCVVLLYNVIGFYIRDYFGLTIPKVIVLLLGIVWVLILHMFDQYKKTPIPYLILSIVLVIMILVAIKYNKSLNHMLNSYYNWSVNTAYGEDTTSVGEGVTLAYSLLSFCIINLLLFPIYLISKLRVGRFVLAISGFITAIVMSVIEYNVDKTVVAFFFAYFFLCLIEFSITKQIKATPKNSQDITTFLTPFAATLLILCCILTTSNKPMKYTLIKNIWSQIEKYGNNLTLEIHNWFDPPINHEFGVAFAGYSESGELGSDVEDSNRVELVVKDINPKDTNIYLIGNIKNEFDGSEWSNTIKKDKFLSQYKESDLQLYELVNAISCYYIPISNQNIIDKRRIGITYHKQSTRTVFSQAYTLEVEKVKNVPKIIEKGDHTEFNKLPKHDPEYENTALQLRLGTPQTNQFLHRQSKWPTSYNIKNPDALRGKVNYFINNYLVTEIDKINEVLEYRAKAIYKNYCKLPDNLSENVINLTKEITKNGSSKYEKLKLLEDYLSTYTYTTHPKALPKNKNLLDYFLFESKEGYCTYFATSMTIMARCIGIPTRYVQGYCIQTKKSRINYNVTGNDAHAWVEAYIDGVGWIPFEPTAGYQNSLYRAREAYPVETYSNNTITAPTVPVYEEIPEVVLPDVVNVEQVNSLTKAKTYLYALAIIFGVALITLLLTLTYFFIIIRFSKATYRKSSTEKKLYILLQRMVFLISRYALCNEENPTLLTQFQALYKNADFDKYKTMEVANKYMQLCYSNRGLVDKDEHEIVAFYQELLLYGKTQLKPLQYYLLILRLAKIKDSKS